MDRRSFLAGATALGLAAPARAETVKVRIGVGGKPLLYYLPLTIAEKKGYFVEEGVEAEINDFGGGARSLQALIGGSVDVVTGAYEHTIRMQAKGQDVRAVCELGRYPAIVIAVRKDLAGTVRGPGDLKGRKIGVTAPGSSTALAVQYAMIKAGLKATDAPLIGVGGGAGAIAAMKKGEIDAISHLDPVIAKLEADGDIAVMIDTRTEAGTRALFGGPNPAAVVYTKQEWIERHAAATQKVVNAFAKSLKWLAAATPEEVADTVPPAYHFGDRPLYVQAVKNSLESYSRTGIPSQEGMASVLDLVRTLDPELQGAKIDLAATLEDRFIRKAMG
ncbi:extracellular solute-binding protein family 3 [Methylobacterium sp. 4-46]|uniref:ABC transporter substrate-binding protein n=1 Tax=unclassified Methylobacterium TaxID=2615210 RepID=UPI000165C77F|nr:MULTISPECIES: ABC transporter substrate-binding protein [Methylobacterium]ACA15947.1 extracellular solute-binding protein family 3 [Methylobacterium sp. 4-46]WFT81664.1 ABC transporter substrate-binding protein [Methylobacterium nodulans]